MTGGEGGPSPVGYTSYGLALRCPRCTGELLFGYLKTPGNQAVSCPNCGGRLVRSPRRIILRAGSRRYVGLLIAAKG